MVDESLPSMTPIISYHTMRKGSTIANYLQWQKPPPSPPPNTSILNSSSLLLSYDTHDHCSSLVRVYRILWGCHHTKYWYSTLLLHRLTEFQEPRVLTPSPPPFETQRLKFGTLIQPPFHFFDSCPGKKKE